MSIEMQERLRVLSIEDDPKDTDLIRELLEADGMVCEVTRVDTEDAVRAALENGAVDLILADFTLPTFDGVSALKLAQQLCPDAPFLFVSGTLGEELAIEAMKVGATDYVLKTRLPRLGPSVTRALREAREKAERKRTSEKLLRNEAYLAEAQKLSRTGSFGWNVTSGEIFWSEETFRIFDCERTRKPTVEFALERTHPEDRFIVERLIEGASGEWTEFDVEYRLQMPGGAVKHVRVVGRRTDAGEGGEKQFVGAITDITEQKLAEQELQLLVDTVPQLIVVLGPDGAWIHANRVAREYTGLTLDEYRSVDVIERVIHPDDAQRMRDVRELRFAARQAFEIDARMLGKDGLYRWFLFRYNPMIEQGRVKKWYATATEIESRKQEEERVRKENVRLEERTRIAQEIHDTLLQTFLGASMQLGVAVDGLPDDSAVKDKLDRILQLMARGIEEGRATVQGLRSSEQSSSDVVLALSRVPEELALPEQTEFRVAVNGRQRAMPPRIRHEIYRIGREALVNAFRHSQAKRIEFEVEYAESDLHLRVRDNGRGIDPAVLESGRARHWGLAGMRERATGIGGTLRFVSNAGAGTEVQLSVPGDIAFEL